MRVQKQSVTPAQHPRVGMFAASMVAILLLSVAMAPQAFAAWGARDSVDAGVVSSGNLDVGLSLDAQSSTPATSLELGDLDNMVPGKPRLITVWVKNSGSVPVDMLLAAGADTDAAVKLQAAPGACRADIANPETTVLTSDFQLIAKKVTPDSTGNATALCLRVTLNPGTGAVRNMPFSVRVKSESSIQ